MAFALSRLVAVVLLGVLSFHGFCISERAPNYTFMKNATAAKPVSYYDYIVVGGGTAGCPLAATLSKSFNVLLLERGGSPGDPNIANLVHYLDTLSDLSPDSPSQVFFSDHYYKERIERRFKPSTFIKKSTVITVGNR